MPAASEAREVPTLPHTWRPHGVRIMLAVVGVGFFALIAAVWVGFGPEIRAEFTFLQRATLVAFALMLGVTYWGLVRCKVVASAESLLVVNGYRSHRYEWSQVVGISLPRGAPWATLDLSDGSSLSAMGVQGSDGSRARQAVREIRACITAQTDLP